MDEIERLELRIEELREAIGRSRRLRLVGRALAIVGPALILGFILGLVAYTPTRMIVALALAIGGVVLTGRDSFQRRGIGAFPETGRG